MTECTFCKEKSTTAVRGYTESDYQEFCSFHAGMMQMILEKLNVDDKMRWKPIIAEGSDKLK